MRIDRIKLQDFRNHSNTDLTFEHLTCIRGKNGSGKSTLAQAIELALTGRADSTDAKGTGAAALIRNGADKAVILLALHANKDVQVRCSLTTKSGRTVTIKDPLDPAYSGDAVMEWFASQKPVLSCLLNSRYFINMKPAEQKSLLSSIVLPTAYEWPEEIRDKLKTAQIKVDWNLPPFELVEAAYSACYDRRRDLNRDLKGLQLPEALPAPAAAATMLEINQSLSNLRSEAQKIATARIELERRAYDRQSRYNALNDKLETLRSKVRNEEETCAAIEKVCLSEKKVKEYTEIAGRQPQMEIYEKDLATIRDGIAAVKGVLAIFDGLDGKKECPLCQRGVTPEWLGAAIKPHLAHQDALIGKERDTMKLMGALGNPAEAKRLLDLSVKDEQNRKRTQAILDDSKAQCSKLEQEVRDVEAALESQPATVEPDTRTAEINREAEALQKQIAAVANYEQRKIEIERVRAQHNRLVRAVGILDELVTYFGKDGVKAQLLSEHVSEFVRNMNGCLVDWGYECQLEMEPYRFMVRQLAPTGWLPLELLSNSERLRFSVAFQVALAQVSGIRMAVIDEVDMLDAAGRTAFYEMLLAADLDQIVAIGTDERTEVPEIPGVAFYAFNDGTAVRLGTVAAEAAA